jgi:hypothetical protein
MTALIIKFGTMEFISDQEIKESLRVSKGGYSKVVTEILRSQKRSSSENLLLVQRHFKFFNWILFREDRWRRQKCEGWQPHQTIQNVD